MLSLIPILALLPFIHGSSRIGPLVYSKQGLIRGLRAENGPYSMFLGIPYGLVNEANPFGSSIPYPTFNDIYEAYDDSVICPQVQGNDAVGTLDCLRLNVYVPNTATSKNRLPVMVWIHGGGFMEGSGNRVEYSPEFLVRHDVIVVGINYRLGAYGFLCLDTPKIPGNQGLKDQLLALRWIKENIEHFGGDASQITVFGESAGAISIDLHLLSNHEKVFDRAIMQSGTALVPDMVGEADTGMVLAIAEKLGYNTDDFEEAVSFLESLNPHLVVAAVHEIDTTAPPNSKSPAPKPCVEKDFAGVEKFVHDFPFNIRSSKIQDIPILNGYNDNEMLIRVAFMAPDVIGSFDFKQVLNTDLSILVNDNVAESVRHFFIADEAPGKNVTAELANFFSDFMITSPADRYFKKYMDVGAKEIYFYVFSYDGNRNYLKMRLNVTDAGAVHADELGYLFGSDFLSDPPTAEDQLIIDRITTLWTNFAKYGNPTPETSELLPVPWVPITDTTHPYLNIDSTLSLQSRPFHDRVAFWDLLYKVAGNSVENRN